MDEKKPKTFGDLLKEAAEEHETQVSRRPSIRARIGLAEYRLNKARDRGDEKLIKIRTERLNELHKQAEVEAKHREIRKASETCLGIERGGSKRRLMVAAYGERSKHSRMLRKAIEVIHEHKGVESVQLRKEVGLCFLNVCSWVFRGSEKDMNRLFEDVSDYINRRNSRGTRRSAMVAPGTFKQEYLCDFKPKPSSIIYEDHLDVTRFHEGNFQTNPCAEVALKNEPSKTTTLGSLILNEMAKMPKESLMSRINGDETIPRREKSMSSININALVSLADSATAEEAKNFEVLPVEIKEALKKEMDDRREQQAASAAKTIISILDSHDSAIVSGVTELKRLRAREAAQKASMAKLNMARQYGLDTNNFLPLANMLGHYCEVDDYNMLTVPEAYEKEYKKKNKKKTNKKNK